MFSAIISINLVVHIIGYDYVISLLLVLKVRLRLDLFSSFNLRCILGHFCD